MQHCADQVGDQYFRTPRKTVKKFVQLLSILGQNPDAHWQDLLDDVTIDSDRRDPNLEPVDDADAQEEQGSGADDELSSFEL
jgi:hypothetical protein